MAKREAFIGRETETPVDPNLISSKVKRRVDRRKGELNELNRDEKMLCALRKALASKSGLIEALSARYYIAEDQIYVTSRSGGAATKKGEPVTYKASGRFKMGIAHKEHVAFRMARFTVTYRDGRDDRGLADVNFIDPTTIDLLAKTAPLIPA